MPRWSTRSGRGSGQGQGVRTGWVPNFGSWPIREPLTPEASVEQPPEVDGKVYIPGWGYEAIRTGLTPPDPPRGPAAAAEDSTGATTTSTTAVTAAATGETSETITLDDGNEYPLAKVEISSASHPFFTGTMKIVDTAGRVERFERRYGKRRQA